MFIELLGSIVLAGSMVTVCSAALAADSPAVAEGAKLYASNCQVCHGDNSMPLAGTPSPSRTGRPWMQLALQSHFGTTLNDAPFSVAVAPPYGPNLRGVYMRVAGTVKGYQYSPEFLKALTGMPWTDAALDFWITNTQAWVPGVVMYYRQEDPAVRHKIIEYLKASP